MDGLEDETFPDRLRRIGSGKSRILSGHTNGPLGYMNFLLGIAHFFGGYVLVSGNVKVFLLHEMLVIVFF